MEDFGMDSQTGFRPDRDPIDDLFATFVKLDNRKEHFLEIRAHGHYSLSW